MRFPQSSQPISEADSNQDSARSQTHRVAVKLGNVLKQANLATDSNWVLADFVHFAQLLEPNKNLRPASSATDSNWDLADFVRVAELLEINCKLQPANSTYDASWLQADVLHVTEQAALDERL